MTVQIHSSNDADSQHQWVLAQPPQARGQYSRPYKYEGTFAWWICHCGAAKMVRVRCDDDDGK